MAGVAFETTNQIVQDAAYDLGLITSDVADVFASTDQSVIQLRNLITRVGRMLVKERPWSHLVIHTTVATVNGTSVYALANDFDRLVENSYWNRTDKTPMGGPINAQIYEYFQANSTSASFWAYLYIQNNEIEIYPTPTAAETIGYAYVSSYWVRPTAQSSPTTTRTTVSTDVLHFEPQLLLSGLKLAFLRAKGMDSTAAQAEYLERLNQVAGSDGASPILNLAPGRPRHGLMGYHNIPDTGYGS